MDINNSQDSAVNDVKPDISSPSSSTLHSILMNNSTASKAKPSLIPSASPGPPASNQASVSNQTSKLQPSVRQASAVKTDQILTKGRLQDLVKEIDPCEQLDDEVEDLLLQMVDDFVTSTVSSACVFAKHRNASTVEAKDVQLYLEKMYQMWLPGFGTDDIKQYKRPPTTEAHKQRLALIRKSLRKY